MSMNSPHESMKQMLGDIWHNNRPLAIAALVILGVIAFVLYKRAQSSVVAPSAPAPTGQVGTGGTFTNTYDSVTVNKTFLGPTPKQPPLGAPPPVGPPSWLPAIPNGSKLLPGWGGLPYGWQAPGSKTVNGLNPPPGTRIWQGSAGRWWYALAGGPETLLTTS